MLIIAKMFISISSFMLCSFGISTEASAPAVLSFFISFQTQYTCSALRRKQFLNGDSMEERVRNKAIYIVQLG